VRNRSIENNMKSEDLSADVAAYLAKGGRVKQVRACSPKEAWYRSTTPMKDKKNPNRILRKNTHKIDRPVVYSGYNTKS
jgi:hypothetical protein